MCVCRQTGARLVHGLTQLAEARMCTLGAFYWCTVSVCAYFSNIFLAAEFFPATIQYSLLSSHHLLVLVVMLVYGNRFLCLICSLVWRSSCSLFQCTMCYCIWQFGICKLCNAPALWMFSRKRRAKDEAKLILTVSWRNHCTARTCLWKQRGCWDYEILEHLLSMAEPGYKEICEPINHSRAAASSLTLIVAF